MISWRLIPADVRRLGRKHLNKKQSREKMTQRNEDAMKKRKVAVIGGGPAGMMAAITAAEQGALVTLFERNDRVGKKLLATGNGRCNLGNMVLSEREYYGASPEWIRSSLERFGTADTIAFFERLGLMLKDKGGYLYPACEQASAVLDVLRIRLSELSVTVRTDCKIERISKSKQGILLAWGEAGFFFDRVIIACGGKAAPKTGSDGNGYELAGKLGHKIVPTVPALVQLRCREEYLKAVAGVRAEAEISVHKNKTLAARERGELQLTDYGISGIPVFQLSRTVNYLLRQQGEVQVSVNFLPDMDEQAFEQLIRSREGLKRSRNLEEYFTGMLNKKLMLLFIRLSGLKPGQAACQTAQQDLKKVFKLCRSFPLRVTGSNPYDSAQVCAGGVDTREITEDMESRKVPGIYFAGEILDVDGRCGGYNLQWAFCSGYLAGMAAAGEKGDGTQKRDRKGNSRD